MIRLAKSLGMSWTMRSALVSKEMRTYKDVEKKRKNWKEKKTFQILLTVNRQL